MEKKCRETEGKAIQILSHLGIQSLSPKPIVDGNKCLMKGTL